MHALTCNNSTYKGNVVKLEPMKFTIEIEDQSESEDENTQYSTSEEFELPDLE